MEELYKVMDDLLDVEFQMKSGIDILKELEELYMSGEKEEESEGRKLAVLMRGYMQSMKANLNEIISYIDDVTLQKKKNAERKKWIIQRSQRICQSGDNGTYGKSI